MYPITSRKELHRWYWRILDLHTPNCHGLYTCARSERKPRQLSFKAPETAKEILSQNSENCRELDNPGTTSCQLHCAWRTHLKRWQDTRSFTHATTEYVIPHLETFKLTRNTLDPGIEFRIEESGESLSWQCGRRAEPLYPNLPPEHFKDPEVNKLTIFTPDKSERHVQRELWLAVSSKT